MTPLTYREVKVYDMRTWKRIHMIPDAEGYVLFFCDDISWKRITETEKNVISEIQKGKSQADICEYYPISEIEYEKLCDLLEEKGGHPEPKDAGRIKLTLNLANTCNMRCKYCYAHGGVYKSEESIMTKETAQAAVDFFMHKFDKISSIKFIGGEPLMNLDVLKFICEYIEDQKKKGKIKKVPSYIVNTNGTILTDEILELINKYEMRVNFSLDGPGWMNDQARIFVNGRGTSHIVEENIRKLQKATGGRCPTSVDAVYTQRHVDQNVSVMDVIHYLKDELHIPKVHVIPVDAKENSPFHLKNSQAYLDAVDEILNDYEGNKEYMFTLLKGMIARIRAKDISPDNMCVGGTELFSVSAAGKIYPCHLLTDVNTYYMGDVHDPEGSEDQFQKIYDLLKNYSRYSSETCRKCFGNKLCIGCLGGNNFRTGDGFKGDPFICSMFREIVEKIIVWEASEQKS